MSENTFPKNIEFHSNHRPDIIPGEYWIDITGTISHKDSDAINVDNSGLFETQSFAILGERFVLQDQDVRGIFPAAGSTGEYESVFPHVVFHRNTLPWERMAVPNATDEQKKLPWLALLLFDEGQEPVKKVITVQQLFESGVGAGHFPTLAPEVGQHNDEKLTVIDVSKELVAKILPSTESLKILAHTRLGVTGNPDATGEENAIVFCNRLPEKGKRSTMHLVSVEGAYNATEFDRSSAADSYRFVSLKSWEFYSIEHFKITTATLNALVGKQPEAEVTLLSEILDREFAGTQVDFLEQAASAVGLSAFSVSLQDDIANAAFYNRTFEGLLLHLNRDMMNLRLPKHSDSNTEAFLSQGMVPMEHQFRNGEKSVSWYRGPLVPVQNDASLDGSYIRNLNGTSADELLQFDEAYGMFDVTYAAAWELGRLLALANKSFSVGLFQWKRVVAQNEHQSNQIGNGFGHLPNFSQGSHGESDAQLWEAHIQPFLTQLANFERVPGNYLIADEALLPSESIRFFNTDKNWQTAILQGAFSIGGEWDFDPQLDNPFNDFLALSNNYLSGFALRSDLIEGWPGMLIEARYGNLPSDATIVRRKLSRDVELFFFDGRVDEVIFYQKPEVMHFGVIDSDGVLTKKERNAVGEEFGEGKPVPWVRDTVKEDRIVDMEALSRLLNKQSNSAEFAMNMIEGVPKVYFYLNNYNPLSGTA